MFNNNNKNNKTVSSTNNSQSPSLNMISEGTKLKGNINSQNDLRIAGHVEGEAISKSKLILSGSGKIVGNVTSEEADIAGTLEGEVKVSNKLILRKSAVINGDIYTKSLLVEEGAQINGACHMGADLNNLSKKKNSDVKNTTSEEGKNPKVNVKEKD